MFVFCEHGMEPYLQMLFSVQCSLSLLPNLMIMLAMKLDESVLSWWVSVISDENSQESIWIIFSSSC